MNPSRYQPCLDKESYRHVLGLPMADNRILNSIFQRRGSNISERLKVIAGPRCLFLISASPYINEDLEHSDLANLVFKSRKSC